jgi:ethanolamine ammonia-lyase small subunit
MAEAEKANPTNGVAEMPSANSSRPSVVEDNIKDVISVRKPSREQLQSLRQATHRRLLRKASMQASLRIGEPE